MFGVVTLVMAKLQCANNSNASVLTPLIYSAIMKRYQGVASQYMKTRKIIVISVSMYMAINVCFLIITQHLNSLQSITNYMANCQHVQRSHIIS